MTYDAAKINSDKDYRIYLIEVDRLVSVDPEPGTPDGDRLVLLAKLVEDYEKGHFKLRRPDADETPRFLMKQKVTRE